MLLMRRLRAVWRLLRLLSHLVTGLLKITFQFPRFAQAQKDQAVQIWSLALLKHMGIALRVHGQVPKTGPVLLAANHISWLDIIVMHAARHCRFISKDDIAKWPVVGTLATAAGTLYIQRESRRDALRVVHQMAACLQNNEVLAVFPEGTTGDGTTVLPFHANLLQAAISANAPVQPVGLKFVDVASTETSLAPCYVGDDTLVGSVWRTLCADPIEAVVHFGPLQSAQGRDRRTWAADVRKAVLMLRA